MMAVVPLRAPDGLGTLLTVLWALKLRGSPQLEVDQPDLSPMPGDSRWGQPSCHWVLLGAVAVMMPILVMCPKGLLDHVASGLGLKPRPSAATSVFRTTRQDCLS